MIEQESLSEEKQATTIDHALAAGIDPRDTLVISGFWRSGTTWLQEGLAEILHAKTVFEPFHFMVPAAKKLFKYYRVAKKSPSFQELFIPYCDAATLHEQPLLYHYVDLALRSDLAGRAIRVLRKSTAESYRTRVVVKFTRGQFLLRAAHNTFVMPIIHVYRDPRAVIASAKMTDWYWLFDHLRLPEQLLDPKDGRADFFGRYADEIRECNRDKVARIAAYWALTEKFLADSFADAHRRIVFVSYEELCCKPEIIAEILERLNMKKICSENVSTMNGDSFSTSNQRRGASSAERISGWKNVLSSAEVATIASVVKRFGFGNRLDEQ